MASIFCRYKDGTSKICYTTDCVNDIKVNGVSIGLVTDYNVNSGDEVEFDIIYGNTDETYGDELLFSIKTLVSVEIGNDILYVGGYMCANCSALESVKIGRDVQVISGYAFANCPSIKTIDFTGALNLLQIQSNAFSNCTSLTRIDFPNTLNNITTESFSGCTSLKTITFGPDIRAFGRWCFRRCTSLEEIRINSNVCPNYDHSYYPTFEYVKSGGTLYYPKGADYSTLLNPNTLYSLGYYGWNGVETDDFEDLDRLKLVCKYKKGSLIFNPSYANSFIDVKINGVSVGDLEQYHYTSSENDVVEFSLRGTSIEHRDFWGCDGLVGIKIDEGVTTIGEGVFNGCTSLPSITIPSTVTSIGRWAFNTGNSTLEIGSLNAIYVKGQSCNIYTETFNSVVRNGTLYYPNGADYSQWLSTNPYYLGYFGWNGVEMNPEDMPEDIPDNPDNPDIPTDPDNPDEPDTPDTPIDPDAPSIDLEYDKIKAPQGGMNTTMDVETENVDDVQVVAPDWVDVIEKDGYYEIIIKPNEDGSDRTGEVIFIGNPSRPNRVQQNVIINQNSDNSEMATSISLEKNKITFDNTGYAENFGVKVTYTNAQEIYAPVCNADWVTITELLPQQGGNTGGDTNATVKRYGFEVTETDIARIATVTFSCKGDTGRVLSNSSFVIEQMGKSEEETNVIVEAFMETGSVKYDGSSTGISIDSLGCGYSNFASVLAPIVNVDWIHLGEGVLQSGYGYDEIYRYPISFDVNEGAERVGVITFVATDEMGDEYTDTCTITQLAKPYEPEKPEIPEGGDNETYSPIWKDVEYVFGGDDVVYEIYAEQYVKYMNQWVKEDVLIFRSRVYAAPNETVVRVNVNKICQNYMTENRNIFTGSVGYGHSFATFKLKDQYGTLLHTYHFINDWSYDELTVGLKTNPITPYIGDGQKLFFTTFATDEKRINWGMRYYDGTPDYDAQEKVSNDFATLVVASSREKGVKTFYFGANSFNILPKCQCKYVLYYVNPKGGYDWFTITGRVSRRDRLETYTVTQNYSNTTTDFGKKRYLSTININYQVNTQWLTQEQSNRMWELLESNTVWLHNLEEDKIYPVIITDTEVEHKYKTNSNKMLSYQINLELSQTRERI